jgi:hypothetical protein
MLIVSIQYQHCCTNNLHHSMLTTRSMLGFRLMLLQLSADVRVALKQPAVAQQLLLIAVSSKSSANGNCQCLLLSLALGRQLLYVGLLTWACCKMLAVLKVIQNYTMLAASSRSNECTTSNRFIWSMRLCLCHDSSHQYLKSWACCYIPSSSLGNIQLVVTTIAA